MVFVCEGVCLDVGVGEGGVGGGEGEEVEGAGAGEGGGGGVRGDDKAEVGKAEGVEEVTVRTM